MGSVGANRVISDVVANQVARAQANPNMTPQEVANMVSAGQSIIKGQIAKTIDKTPFKNEGGGQWTMDIEGVGGGQILDERDSSRAGFGSGPAYGITVWDRNYNSSEQTIYYGSLNEAKAEFKRRLKELIG